MSDKGPGFKFDPEWRITLFVLVMVPLMVGLGFWQLQRAEEKASLAAAFERRQLQPPAELGELWDMPADSLAYTPVILSGEFLPDKYFLLDNRILGGRFGYEVLGIVELQDSGRMVLVDRGWIAGDPARLQRPEVPEVSGLVRLTGHVYVAPGAPYLLAEQSLAGDWPKLLQAVEMDKLVPVVEAISGVSVFSYPIRIDAGAPGALSVDWQVVNVSPQKHQGYAVQWFAMALVLSIFYLLRCSNLWQLLRGPIRAGN
jgi:surfeit locus 1 family protein